jgi:hypothetical protein
VKLTIHHLTPMLKMRFYTFPSLQASLHLRTYLKAGMSLPLRLSIHFFCIGFLLVDG